MILVLGSEGFVGRGLCRHLEERGYGVRRFDIKRSEKEDCRVASLPFSNIEFVYFLAWNVGGAKFLYSPNTQVQQMEWNVAILNNIMPQLKRQKVPFMFVSSRLAADTGSAYGVGKRMGEVWSALIGGQVVRLWNVYGDLEKDSIRSHVVSDIVTSAVNSRRLQLLTTGEERRQFVHIDDVCRGLEMVREIDEKRTVDICSERWISIGEVAGIVGSITGSEVVLGEARGASDEACPARPLGDWEPLVNLEEGIRRMVRELSDTVCMESEGEREHCGEGGRRGKSQ